MNSTLKPLNHQLDAGAGVLSITIPGDILSTNADILRGEIFSLLESMPIHTTSWNTLRLDLTCAQMIDSVGLNLVVSVVRAVKSRDGAVEALVRSANIYRTFSFTRLDRQIRVIRPEAQTEAAVAAKI